MKKTVIVPVDHKVVLIRNNDAYGVHIPDTAKDVTHTVHDIIDGLDHKLVRLVHVGKGVWNENKRRWGFSEWTYAHSPNVKVPHEEMKQWAETTTLVLVVEGDDRKKWSNKPAVWLKNAKDRHALGTMGDLMPVDAKRDGIPSKIKFLDGEWPVGLTARQKPMIVCAVKCSNCESSIPGKARVVQREGVWQGLTFVPDAKEAKCDHRKWYCGCTKTGIKAADLPPSSHAGKEVRKNSLWPQTKEGKSHKSVKMVTLTITVASNKVGRIMDIIEED